MAEVGERRSSYVDLEKAITETNERNKWLGKQYQSLQEQTIRGNELAARSDEKLGVLAESVPKLAENLEKVASQAVEATVRSKDTKTRIEKLEDVQTTMSVLVSRHDTKLEALEGAHKTRIITWLMALVTLGVVFGMFVYDGDAATNAIDTVKGEVSGADTR